MNKIIGVIGKRYCLFRKDGECVLFDKKENCFVDDSMIDKNTAELVLEFQTEEALDAASRL